jgi:DNA mismatch endonuclease, patch repair protein
MARIRSKDTKPELLVRRLIHSLGYRYRLHPKDLPGRPDLVFRSRKSVIFVHGCFWHRHSDPSCRLARLPKSRLDFWLPKLTANQLRDKVNLQQLQSQGWRVLTIWECELSDDDKLRETIEGFLEGADNNASD